MVENSMLKSLKFFVFLLLTFGFAIFIIGTVYILIFLFTEWTTLSPVQTTFIQLLSLMGSGAALIMFSVFVLTTYSKNKK